MRVVRVDRECADMERENDECLAAENENERRRGGGRNVVGHQSIR